MFSRFVLPSLVVTFICLPHSSFALRLPENPPIPKVSPQAATQTVIQSAYAPFKPGTTSILPAISELEKGLNALDSKNGPLAINIRNKMPKKSLDRHILTWAIGISGNMQVPSSEIKNSLNELSDWPGLKAMQMNSERALTREILSPKSIIANFSDKKPLTIEGIAALCEALIATGQKEKARTIVLPWWYTVKLSYKDEALLINKIGSILNEADYRQRMITMLYMSRIKSASILAKSAGALSLYEAATAVIRNEKSAQDKIATVDEALKDDPLYRFIQIKYLRRNDKIGDATKLMLGETKITTTPAISDAWGVERRALSRELLDIDKPGLAYDVMANYKAENPTTVIDAEFHAGWYALRFLDDPQKAMMHFARIPDIATRSVSKARGYYWMARAAKAMQDKETADRYFKKASYFGTTYYGQLAAAYLGIKSPQISQQKATAEEQKRFSARSPVLAIQRLEEIGYSNRAKTLYIELAKSLTASGELTLLSNMAEQKDDHYTSLIIGKNAASRGIDVGVLTHPIGAIPDSANISAAGKALAYAIARQESEFRVDAVSHVGARGMLQLMPATAKAVAKDHNIPYTLAKLTNDAGYNATLGAHFLGEQLRRFDGSYILTFIGYNAGPRRAIQWIERYGDPRGQSITEIVDWIERIPYTETRDYVMRVMENYETYKIRLTGEADIGTDLISGRNL